MRSGAMIVNDGRKVRREGDQVVRMTCPPGRGTAAGRVLLFFYFQEANTGIAALIPGTGGAMDVARFRLTAGLADPRKN